ncbi:hypothetical protein A3B57_01245 [Microgenomates group bacterium RIFCSPLOWO2_01_FULL_47_10]|nr:MAG: hypothetical protein A3B57_01245 [Microgenomates group bacterium RIFCSPLOWO2_01_FULL_47_10]
MTNPLKNSATWAILYYLRFFARLQLRKFHPLIIGVTGSAGKSSCVAAIECVLTGKRQIKATKQLNSETGIPLAILDIAMEDYTPADWLKAMLLAPAKILTNWKRFDTFVVEMGIDSPVPPKNMEYLLTIVQPAMGVFLNVAGAHTQNFDALVGHTRSADREFQLKNVIGREKGKLIESLPESGWAVLNLDDINVTPTIGKVKGQVVTIGFDPAATVCIKSVTPSLTGTVIDLSHEGKNYTLNVPKAILPRSYGYTFTAAVAVGLCLDVTIAESMKQLSANFKLPPGRGSLLSGINHTFLLDSSYNASMATMLESLDLLSAIAPARKIAILGDMNELGKVSQLAHEQVAQKARAVCDQVYLVGSLMQRFAYPILQHKAVVCRNAKQAAVELAKTLHKDDMVLIKGSQNGIFLEYAVEKLLLNPTDAAIHLCRRGSFWQANRRELGLD